MSRLTVRPGPLLADEHADALVGRIGVRVGLRRDGVQRAVARVGDEHLAAVEDVDVAAAHRGGADALHVAAGVRLGQAQRAVMLAARHRRQVALLLLVGAVHAQHVRQHQMGVEHAAQAHPALAQLLDHHGVGGDVEAEAAVLRRDGGAEQSQLLHARDQRVRILVAVFELAGDRHDLAVDEAPDSGENFFTDVGCQTHGILHCGPSAVR